MQKRWKELDLGVESYSVDNLDDCLTLFHDLELNDPEAVRPLTLKELEKYDETKEDAKAGPGPATQAHREELPTSIEMFNEEYMKKLIDEEVPSVVEQQDG